MSNSAFTLIELLVSLMILSILAGVGVVGYAYYVEQAAVAADEAYVREVWRQAQLEAQAIGHAVRGVWISITEIAPVAAVLESNPVQALMLLATTAQDYTFQSNTYTEGGAQFLTYDGEHLGTASGNPGDLRLLQDIYRACEPVTLLRVETGILGELAALQDSLSPISLERLSTTLQSARFQSEALILRNLQTVDGVLWHLTSQRSFT